MRKSTLNFILAILFPTLVGVLSAFLTSGNMELYQTIVQPPLAPPPIVFPIAWTILYIMMGAASYFSTISSKSLHDWVQANLWYLLQLAMNFLWSIFFFNLKLYLFSLIWLIGMYAAIIVCTVHYFRIDKRAGWLMVPYNIWMAFATYLNLAIVIMNG